MSLFKFGDAAGENAKDIPYAYAALYSADCDFPTPPDIAAKWDTAHRRWFTFRGDPACSMTDFEPGVQMFDDENLFHGWLVARNQSDSTRHPWVYSDLSNAQKAAEWAKGQPFKWNVADWNGPKSRAELSNLLIEFGVPVHQAGVETIAAQQYSDGQPPQFNPAVNYDSNICFQYW